MYYYIDGYNFLFSCTDIKGSLQLQREQFIQWVQATFARLNLQGTIVFDGSHRSDEHSGLSYPSPLEVAYSPRGCSADTYIIEKISNLTNSKLITVVTNDTGLRRHVHATGAYTESNDSFIRKLLKKKKRQQAEKQIRDSDAEIQRLLNIFEKRLEDKE